jgi:hypothetical protein
MRKLTPDEEHALAVLRKHESYCPPWDVSGDALVFVSILQGLVKKKRVRVEEVDGGFRYHAA